MMIMAGTVVFLILAFSEAFLKGNISQLISLPFLDTGFMITVFYQGVCCSILAFFLSNVAISRIGVNRTSSFIGISTVISIIAGRVFLHERLTFLQIIGAMVIIAGVHAANTRKKQEIC